MAGVTPVTRGALIRFENGQLADRVDFQFNPTEYNEVMEVEWSKTEAMGQFIAAARFSKFKERVIEMKLLFYDREGDSGKGPQAKKPGYCDRQIAKCQLFANPGSNFGPDTPFFVSPGHTVLIFGRRSWRCVVSKVDVQNQVFSRTLLPTMATVTMTMDLASGGFAQEMAYLDGIRLRAGLGARGTLG